MRLINKEFGARHQIRERQATVQLLISPQNVAHATIIFRGKGTVLKKERHLYNQDVGVMFQESLG